MLSFAGKLKQFKNSIVVHLLGFMTKKKRPRRDSNPQSSDSKSDALSIRPRGQTHEEGDLLCFHSGEN